MEQSKREIKGDNDIKEGLKYKGTEFWREKIKNMGIEIEPSDSITIEIVPPLSDAKYGEPIRKNTGLNGKNVDIYRLGNEIYLHVKE
jgi:hypothetical protein